MPLTLVDRFRPAQTRQQQAEIADGKLRLIAEFEVLSPDQLRPLAQFSLILLIIGAILFTGLNIAAYFIQVQRSIPISGWGLLLWFVINIVAYIAILPLHEAIHSLAFSFWGGKPYFGAKLPFALYCGAKNQLFHRNHYLLVGLAPLVVISLAAIILTVLAPSLASYIIFATIGNISGAAGDIWSASRLLGLPRTALIEDTDSGYRAWQIGI